MVQWCIKVELLTLYYWSVYKTFTAVRGEISVNPVIFEWPQARKKKRWKKLKLVCNTMALWSLHWWSQLWSLTTAGLSPNLQLWRQSWVNMYSDRNMYSIGMSEGTHFYKNFNSCNVWMAIISRKKEKSREAKHTSGMRHRRQNGTSLWWQG